MCHVFFSSVTMLHKHTPFHTTFHTLKYLEYVAVVFASFPSQGKVKPKFILKIRTLLSSFQKIILGMYMAPVTPHGQ